MTARAMGAASMTPWAEAALGKYSWVLIGLTFGLAAKYALLIKRGIGIKPSLLLADIMILPMVALIAYWLIERAGIHGESAALMTALATVGADRIVKLYTERFIRGVDALMVEQSMQAKARIREEIQTELSAERNLKDIAEGKRPLGGE